MNLYKKAVKYLEKKKYPAAIHALDAALSSGDVSKYFGYYNKAVCYLEMNEPNESLVWFIKALEERPDDVDSHVGAGKCLYRMGAYEKSETYFLHAVSVDKCCIKACNDLGVICFVQGRFEEARDWFLKALEIDGSYADALYNIADTYDELGDSEEAQKYRDRYSAF